MNASHAFMSLSIILCYCHCIAQAVTELDNKMAHRQINDLPYCVVRREYLAFFDSCTDNAVQRLDCMRGVNGLTDIWRITEERIEIFPVRTPAFTDLRRLIVPAPCTANITIRSQFGEKKPQRFFSAGVRTSPTGDGQNSESEPGGCTIFPPRPGKAYYSVIVTTEVDNTRKVLQWPHYNSPALYSNPH